MYKGFTLIEILALLTIFCIILLIVFPVISSIIEKGEAKVCASNRFGLQRSYELYLDLESVFDSEVKFSEFTFRKLDSVICPQFGEISYANGDVNYSKHLDDSNQGLKEGVPFL